MLRLAILALVLCVAGLALPLEAKAACLSDRARFQLINSGQVVSFSSVQARLRAGGLGEAQSARLCESGGGFVYEVVAVSAGRAVRVILDARSGQILQVQ